jgi:hypothetical protein
MNGYTSQSRTGLPKNRSPSQIREDFSWSLGNDRHRAGQRNLRFAARGEEQRLPFED